MQDSQFLVGPGEASCTSRSDEHVAKVQCFGKTKSLQHRLDHLVTLEWIKTVGSAEYIGRLAALELTPTQIGAQNSQVGTYLVFFLSIDQAFRTDYMYATCEDYTDGHLGRKCIRVPLNHQ